LIAAAIAFSLGATGGGAVGFALGLASLPAATVEGAPEAASDDPLGAAQQRVADLERDVMEGERRVQELERQAATNATLAADLERAKGELAKQKSALAAAVQEKERLLGQLAEVTTELAAKTQALDAAREEVVNGRWQDFTNEAVLAICDKGNRKKLGDCRSVVAAALGSRARSDRFAHCLRSGQAMPAIREWTQGAPVPPFSEALDEAQKDMRGWIIIFCDPSLPELPAPAPPAASPPAATIGE
jgi:small-conductance mechanosensitive channel